MSKFCFCFQVFFFFSFIKACINIFVYKDITWRFAFGSNIEAKEWSILSGVLKKKSSVCLKLHLFFYIHICRYIYINICMFFWFIESALEKRLARVSHLEAKQCNKKKTSLSSLAALLRSSFLKSSSLEWKQFLVLFFSLLYPNVVKIIMYIFMERQRIQRIVRALL